MLPACLPNRLLTGIGKKIQGIHWFAQFTDLEVQLNPVSVSIANFADGLTTNHVVPFRHEQARMVRICAK